MTLNKYIFKVTFENSWDWAPWVLSYVIVAQSKAQAEKQLEQSLLEDFPGRLGEDHTVTRELLVEEGIEFPCTVVCSGIAQQR